MSFKNYFTEALSIEEASSFNAGYAMEGIFAIGVALYIADGYIDKDKLNAIRKQIIITPKKPFEKIIDSNIAVDGWIANKLPHIQPGNKLSVKVIINLHPKASDAFGPEAKPIPNIDNSIDQMTNQISHTKAIKRIEQFIIKVLTDRKPDDITFYIEADGTKGASSGQEIKGDVKLHIKAKTNTNVPYDIDSIQFSLKTDNIKTSELSIFTAALRLGNFFELPITKGLESLSSFPTVTGLSRTSPDSAESLVNNKFKTLSENPHHLMFYVKKIIELKQRLANPNTTSKEQIYQTIEEMLWIIARKVNKELEIQLQNKSETYDISKKTFDFLEKEIFGEDMAEVIKILPTGIKEITKEDFDLLRNKYRVEVAIVGDIIKFIGIDKEKGNREVLFTIKPLIQPAKKTERFDIELGPIFQNLLNN